MSDSIANRFELFRRRDENSGSTAYLQVANFLREEIHAARYRPGHLLPTEKELTTSTGLGRQTIRAALSLLNQDGLIVRQPGRGTIVRLGSPHDKVRVTANSEQVFGGGLDTPIQVIEEFSLQHNDAMRDLLKSPTDQVAKCVFTRENEGARVGLWTIWLPTDVYAAIEPVIGDLDNSSESVLRLVEIQTGREASRAVQTMTAEAASVETAELLNVSPGTPLLRAERIYYEEEGYPLEFVSVCYIPDYYDYKIEFIRPGRSSRSSDRAGKADAMKKLGA